jgi:hypothetical protein
MGFFREDVHVALQSSQHRLGMQRVGRADIDRFDTGVQERLDIGKDPPLYDAPFLSSSLNAYPPGMAQGLQKSIPQPRRHLLLPIESYQENIQWQNSTIPKIMRRPKNIR